MATPPALPADSPRLAQSLYQGAAGIALVHIERAHNGKGSWQSAHGWVTAAARAGVSAADDSGLHFGAPALAYVLHTAGADGITRYGSALANLDQHVTALTHRRVDAALARIDSGALPDFAEYDLLHGLTGIGAHLLQHAPGADALGRVLGYLVSLTAPMRFEGTVLPGWWVPHDPRLRRSPDFPGGHANLGIAHGITGPLALFAQALRRGVTVDGQHEAIDTICTWLDTWRQNADLGVWWPQWITREELRTGRPKQRGPLRPSWCYGTPGLARAQQLAAVATHDTARQQIAESALAWCLSDPAQLARITDGSLCHGWAGLHQTAWRAAQDARTPEIRKCLPYITGRLVRSVRAGPQEEGEQERHNPGTTDSDGLLEGAAGLALALQTVADAGSPISAWDAFLLIN
ncbi:lanthionine synthetase C family protein [Streptomyces sp. NBC_01476]